MRIIFLIIACFITTSCLVSTPQSKFAETEKNTKKWDHNNFMKSECTSCHIKSSLQPILGTPHGQNQTCTQCHSQDSTWLPSMPIKHINITQDITKKSCSSCHGDKLKKIPDFFTKYSHSKKGKFSDNAHNFGNQCSKCHFKNSDAIKWKEQKKFSGSCASCHASDFKIEDNEEHEDGLDETFECDDCHNVQGKWGD